jgi:BASS family bile acid:Na+ symporter
LKGIAVSLSHGVERYFLALLIGAYCIAAVYPSPGLWIRAVSFGEVEVFGEKTAIALPMAMLALLLVAAGLGVDLSRLKHLAHAATVLLIGLGANLTVPLAYIFGTSQALRLWPDPTEVQSILLGLALVAAMPIAGSSTAWSQMVNGDLSLSLGLVVASTMLSPLATPVVLHAIGLMLMGDSAEELHLLAANGTGVFLILCVAIPSALGIFGRWSLGGSRIDAIKAPIRLASSLNLLLLNYANASLSLPHALAHPDIDFLMLTLAVVLGLCVLAFGSGWLIGWFAGADRAERSALVFGLGMNNNGTGLVLASMALADFPRVMLPIILYNLLQHLMAGSVAFWLGRTARPDALIPAEASMSFSDQTPAHATARGA